MRGGPGRTGRAWIEPGGRPVTKASITLTLDEIIVLEVPGGGGYGQPLLRPDAAIEYDIDEAYVSREAALRDYRRDHDAVALGDGR